MPCLWDWNKISWRCGLQEGKPKFTAPEVTVGDALFWMTDSRELEAIEADAVWLWFDDASKHEICYSSTPGYEDSFLFFCAPLNVTLIIERENTWNIHSCS